MPARRPFSMLMLCLVTGISVFSQAPPVQQRNFYVQHFGEDEGLPQNSVNDFLPDANGFLWIATEGGMVRFNGNRFLPVQVNAATNSNFSRIKAFYYKGHDTIIGFAGASKIIALVVNNRIVAFEERDLRKQGILLQGRHQPLPVPSYLVADTSRQLRQQWNASDGNVKGSQYSKDTFAITTNHGVGFYSSQGMVSEQRVDQFHPERLVYIDNTPAYIDEQNNIVFYTPRGAQEKLRVSLPGNGKYAFYQNNFGPGVFCVAGNVLYHITRGQAGLVANEMIGNLQAAADIRVIYVKDSNTIVIGTTANGLYLYKKSFFALSDFLPDADNNVFYVQQLLADNETIITSQNKLFRYTQYVGEIKQPYPLYQYALLKDKEGYLWYFYHNHLLRSRTIGVKVDTVFTVNGLPGMLFEDMEGRVWMASEKEFGCFIGGQFHAAVIEGCSPYEINCMAQDASGTYYIGTKTKGVYTIGNKYKPVARPAVPSLAFEIRYILPEAEGRIWVCTYGRGLFLVEKGNITQFPQKEGMLSYVHCIITDRSGHFWLPTNNGLYVVSRQSLLAYAGDHDKVPFYYRFSKKSGLRTNEFNGATSPAYLRLPNGQVSLSSMHGLVQFNPDDIQTDLSATPVLVEKIFLDSSEVSEDALPRISSSVRNIRLLVSTAFWANKENELLEYRIDEENSNGQGRWLKVDESGIINFISLSHGKYRLMLRKRTGLEAGDFVYRTVDFYVAPKWYQTTAFFVAVNIAAIALVLAFSYWRRASYRKTNRILKQQIEEKEIAEQKLIREKGLSQSIINSLPGVFFIYNEQRKHLVWNRNLEKVTGHTAEELAAKPAGSCVEPSDLPLFIEAAQRTLQSGHAELEVTVLNEAGEKACFYLNEIAIMYEGKPAILAIGIDISMQKKAEQEKERANYLLNERIKELTTLYKAGVILQQQDASIENIVQQFVSILPAGWQYPNITAARVSIDSTEFTTPGFGEGPHRLEATFSTGGGRQGRIEIVYLQEVPPETEGAFLAEERKLLDMLADMLGIYFTRKEAIDRAVLAEKKQAEYTQSLEEMLFMTSHEVRRPVANLLGLAELAENAGLTVADQKQFFRHIKFLAHELDDFTRKLTHFIYEIKQKHSGNGEE